MKIGLELISALLLIAASNSSSAQEVTRPWEEYGKLINSRETIASLGPTLFGDQVDLNTGALSFSATDVSIPGNSKLSVAFSRTFKVSNRKGYLNDSTLADWELDAPKLSGVFAPGWKSTRCSVASAAAARPAQVSSSGTVFNPEDFWQGNHADMPGGGEMLYANGASTAPSTGGPYYWMTAGLTYFSCLPTAKNEGGQGFLAITADGTKYWFDWMAQYAEPWLKGGQAGSGQIARRRNVLYATRVEDRFGNWVTYTYTNAYDQPARLTSIQANDGRQITVGYNAQGHVASVSTGTQTWTYQYSYPTPTTGTLTAVMQPDNSQWSISFSALSSAKIRYDQGQPGAEDPVRSCGDPGQVITGGAQGTITHPSGATGTFQVEPERHGRSNVPMVCSNYTIPNNNANDDVAYYPLAYDAFSLKSKTISGPGLATMQWNYSYGSTIFFAPGTGPVCTGSNCGAVVCTSDACAGTSVAIVTGPGGEWTRYTYGNSYRYNEGKLLKVEKGSGPTAIAQTQTISYNLATSGQPFPTPIATSPQPRGDGFTSEYLRPQLSTVIAQDGVTYSRTVGSFDAWARPTSITRFSNISDGYARTDVTEYHDDLSKWVLSQVRRSYTGGIKVSETEFNASAQPYRVFRYNDATPVQTLTYSADGTVATFKDGNGNVTTLSNWKRGVPQSIHHPATPESPSGSTQSASVNDSGWIDWVADENGHTTNYQYDNMGRVSRVVYPTGDTTPWNDKTFSFQQINESEFGIPAGHWRHVTHQGNYQKVTIFDALWRPLWEYQRDITNNDATYSLVGKSYDLSGRKAFVSYPRNPYADGNWAINTGTRTSYDALDRVTRVEQDSELSSPTATTTEYLNGGEIRVTDPRGYQTRTRYAAWDQPSTDYPIEIFYPEGGITQIWRDYFFKPTQIRRSGNNAGQTVEAIREYEYDAVQRLCRVNEPETGSTVMGYDYNDNLTWSASGLTTLAATGCEHMAAYQSGRRSDRLYDARNRVTDLSFPDGNGNQHWDYTKDGLPSLVRTWNNEGTTIVDTVYTYNKRRLPIKESLLRPYEWAIGYGYDSNGNLATQTYPTGLALNYAPNALGQATQVATAPGSTTTGTYASGISYHPNGAIKQFTYGNGIIHTMIQNARQLPQTTQDGNVAGFTSLYDANGNTTLIDDLVQGQNFKRYLSYDGLNRLAAAGSAMFGGSTHYINYAYDPLDNIRSVSHPAVREHSYWYDANNRLTNVQNANGATVTGLGYDVQGNVINKNGQQYSFDYGNRLRRVMGKENYRYDSLGRRSEIFKDDGSSHTFQYGQSGQLLFSSKISGAGVQTTHENVYLGGSLIATIDHNWPSNTIIATKYQHTDALGSPVATSDISGALIERTNYEPYGSAINKTVDGIGYTGHVMDEATGLTYMQQRYYDPTLGRFMSADPVTVNSNSGANFNRYWYANNNPYAFVDPDGRESESVACGTDTTCRISGGMSPGTINGTIAGTRTSVFGSAGEVLVDRSEPKHLYPIFNIPSALRGQLPEDMVRQAYDDLIGAATSRLENGSVGYGNGVSYWSEMMNPVSQGEISWFVGNYFSTPPPVYFNHTHGNGKEWYESYFSRDDTSASNRFGIPVFMANGSGEFRAYLPGMKTGQRVRTGPGSGRTLNFGQAEGHVLCFACMPTR
ncbi:RHS repeat domain-containing protein [Lysobacter gummosus]|uniref:RHS repeat protein n=1 Tax=Lysobacter gummosus TaxID=262324 RepID=A0ABY3X9A1_9GAMM|nr:RHS repeat-associated core domain-containing protein [Lysobacter gummosus]ALN93751.1 RHS repeat-associated core domain protein [Lysobacter gummosus]UNP29178.1 RHS repeat protein [Lysobacter gummosus]